MKILAVCTAILTIALSVSAQSDFDIIIKGGMIYDGSGRAPIKADVGIKGDMIEKIGDLSRAKALTVIDATGLAVAPGFINMLSWSTESLIVDPRSLGELKQGVTTQIMGEGNSMGPLNDRMKKQMKDD
ncbi:MAG: aminoacylase, partial [Acidobacteria bacterium]